MNSRNEVLSEFIQCIGEAMELDSDDSEKEDILIGKRYAYIHTYML